MADWISKEKFKKIKIGDGLKLRFMKGDNIVTDVLPEPKKDERIKPYVSVKFLTGPWAIKNEIQIIREQIKSIK